MNNIEKVKRQLSKPISVIIKNSDGEEDEFMFKPLNIEQQAIMMEISKKMNSKDMIKIEGEEVPDVSKEDMIEVGELIFDVVKNSMPDLEESVLRQFSSDNFDQLSNALVDLMPKGSGDKELVKKKLEELRNAKAKSA